MRRTNPNNNQHFLLFWIGSSVLVWFPAVFAVGMIAMGLGFFFSIFDTGGWYGWDGLEGFSYFSSTIFYLYMLLTLIVGGGLIGFFIGILQHRLMTHRLHLQLENWRRLSVIGGALGAPAAWVVLEGLFSTFGNNGRFLGNEILEGALPMVVFATVLSALQWVELRHHVRSAWLWVIANAIGGLFFGMLFQSNGDPNFGDWLLGAITQGAITGFVLLWLVQRMGYRQGDLAYEPVPIKVAQDKPRESSVWDDAY